MKKKLFSLILCSFLIGCVSPERRAEKLAQNINQESLKKAGSSSCSVKKNQPHTFLESAVYLVCLPVQVGAKGIYEAGRVCTLAIIRAPFALLQLPFQIVHDLANAGKEVGKTIHPPEKPIVK